MNKISVPIPKVSALITTFNAESYISASVSALLAQTYANLEIVVVDDGSIDTTKDILMKLSKENGKLKVFFPGRIGRARALNYGISKCKGSFIAINDADDFSKPHRISKQVEYLLKNPKVGLLGSAKEIVENNRRWTTPVAENNEEIRKVFAYGQPIQHSTVIFRKEVLLRCGGYNEDRRFLLDRDVFLKAALLTEMHQLPEALVVINRSSDQYFRNRFQGIPRKWASTVLQLRAVRYFGFPPILKVKILLGFLWGVIIHFYQRLFNEK